MKLLIPLFTLLLLAGCDAQTFLECTERASESHLTVIDAATGEILTETAAIHVNEGSIFVNTDGATILLAGGPTSITVEHDGYEEQAFFLGECSDDSELIIELIAL